MQETKDQENESGGTPKKIVFIGGPESSGTRIFTEALSQHSQILGNVNAKKHGDVLDDYFNKIKEQKNENGILNYFKDYNTILTRRSFPHSKAPGKPAHYMEFPPIDTFFDNITKENIEPLIFITTRSPVPNLLSWTNQRSSPQGDHHKAYEQYKRTYQDIIEVCHQYSLEHYFISLEGLILDKKQYINSLFKLIGVDPEPVKFRGKKKVNKKWYC